ncbi:hypothetical protein SA60_3871 [Salmonella enterica subsp. enterica serovar Agona str. 60.O.08]|nr:hypothetical protein SA60_3871 [Salmonella enterica subsp. enterica serovar Agona str. 60.O.08]
MFPAPAGINRNCLIDWQKRWSVPRASGDKPASRTTGSSHLLCSPRQRG